MSIITKILTLIFCLHSCNVLAQEEQIKSPKKAAIYSAIIPGSGQIYTKKYWKVPIIYAGLITSAYYINESNINFKIYKNSYLQRISGNSEDEFLGQYSDSDLKTLTDHYKRNREISVLCFIGTYILNIIDASVNAHLFYYDISDDLSLKIEPIIFFNENASGLSFSFKL